MVVSQQHGPVSWRPRLAQERLKQWGDAALAARGVRAIRLIQSVLSLTQKHPRERVLVANRPITVQLQLVEAPIA